MQQIQEISTKRKDVHKLKAYYVFFTGKLSIGQKEKTKENGIIPNQMLCNLSDILLNKAFCLGTIVTCSFAVERIKFFPKMNKLQETSAIHIIFTVTDLKIVQSQKFVDWKNDHDSKKELNDIEKYHSPDIVSICFQYPSWITHICALRTRCPRTLLRSSLSDHMLKSDLRIWKQIFEI